MEDSAQARLDTIDDVHHGTVTRRPLDDRNVTGAEGYFLRYAGPATGAPDRPWPVHYEHVQGRYVAYWFFYAQSQPVKVGEGVIERVVSSRWLDTLGTHQGDWEHVTIRLEGDEPVEMAATLVRLRRRLGSLGQWYRAKGVVGRRRETAGPLGPSRWKTEVAPEAWR